MENIFGLLKLFSGGYSAANFPILAFSSAMNCSYGPCSFLVVSTDNAFFNSSLAAAILDEGADFDKGPLGLVKQSHILV